MISSIRLQMRHWRDSGGNTTYRFEQFGVDGMILSGSVVDMIFEGKLVDLDMEGVRDMDV